MDHWISLLVVAVWLVLGNVIFRYLHNRYNKPLYDSILKRWMRREGFELLEMREAAWWETTPFHGKQSGFPCIVFLRVRDAKGCTRTGWARIGHWLYGPNVDQVEVVWDSSPLLDPE